MAAAAAEERLTGPAVVCWVSACSATVAGGDGAGTGAPPRAGTGAGAGAVVAAGCRCPRACRWTRIPAADLGTASAVVA